MSSAEDCSSVLPQFYRPVALAYKTRWLVNREHSRVLTIQTESFQSIKMRGAALVLLIVALTAVVESSPGLGDNRRPAPYVNRLPPPRPRFRRSPSPDPQGSLSATWQKNLNGPERRPSYNVDYQHRIFENKHGSISATAGAQKFPGQRWEPNVGIQGSFRFRRSPEPQPDPQGSLSATWEKNLNGPERRPSYNVDYQHRIFENQHGSISATAGAQKFPGQRWEPNVGIQGSFRFRRATESEPEEAIDHQE